MTGDWRLGPVLRLFIFRNAAARGTISKCRVADTTLMFVTDTTLGQESCKRATNSARERVAGSVRGGVGIDVGRRPSDFRPATYRQVLCTQGVSLLIVD